MNTSRKYSRVYSRVTDKTREFYHYEYRPWITKWLILHPFPFIRCNSNSALEIIKHNSWEKRLQTTRNCLDGPNWCSQWTQWRKATARVNSPRLHQCTGGEKNRVVDRLRSRLFQRESSAVYGPRADQTVWRCFSIKN